MRCSNKLEVTVLAMIIIGIDASPGCSVEPTSRAVAAKTKATRDEEIARLSRVAVGLIVTGRQDRYLQAMSLVEVLGRHAQKDMEHAKKQVGDFYSRWRVHFRKSREMGEWVAYYKEMLPSIGIERRIYEVHWTAVPRSAHEYDAWLRRISARLTLVSKMIEDSPEPAQKRLDRLIAKSSERKERGLALHRAINYGDRLRALELITNDGVLDVRDSDGWTVLHLAVYWSHPKIVSALLNKGMDPNVTIKTNKATAFDVLVAVDPKKPTSGDIIEFQQFRITDQSTIDCVLALTKFGGRGTSFDRVLVASANTGVAGANELIQLIVEQRQRPIAKPTPKATSSKSTRD